MTGFSKKLFFVILFAALSAGATLLFISRRSEIPNPVLIDSKNRISQELASEIARIEIKEQKMRESVWAQEILAQECGRTFESLWDSINAATNKLEIVAAFSIGEILFGEWNSPETLSHGIEVRRSKGAGPALLPGAWRRFVDDSALAGWQLVQTEFRHNRFDTNATGQPHQSRFYFSAHLMNHARLERAVLEGDLVVDWAAKRASAELVKVKRIDASGLTIKTRRGEQPFQTILAE